MTDEERLISIEDHLELAGWTQTPMLTWRDPLGGGAHDVEVALAIHQRRVELTEAVKKNGTTS